MANKRKRKGTRKPRKKPMPSVPWNRRPNETNPAWLAFTTYRDMGPARSLSKVVRKLGRKPSYKTMLDRWSPYHEWVSRCESYDAEMDRIAREERAKGIRDMERRHLALANSLQMVGAEGIKALLERVRSADPKERIELTPYQIRALVKCGTDIERKTRGEPEVIVEQRHGVADDGGKTRDALRGLLGVPAIADAAGELATTIASYNGNGAAPHKSGQVRTSPDCDDEEDRDT